MKKKILIAYDSMLTGGTTTALLSILEKIDAKYDIDIALFQHSGAYIESLPKNVNLLNEIFDCEKYNKKFYRINKILFTILNLNFFKAICLFFKYKKTSKGKFRNILSLCGIKAQVKMSIQIDKPYDVAIGFMEGWSNHYIMSNKVSAKKKILWVHPNYKNSILIPEIDKNIFDRSDNIIVVSEECKKDFIKVFPSLSERVLCIENINSRANIINRSCEYEFTTDEIFNLCTISRCHIDVKGLDRIVIALLKLKNENLLNNVVWNYIGDGRDIKILEDLVIKFGLSKNVKIHGFLVNPLPVLKKMDLFILASRYEGKPIAVTEAMLLDVPCLVTNYSSAYEQVANNENGIVVENNDDSLYHGLKYILQNKEILLKFKENINYDFLEKESEINKIIDLIEN